MFLLPCVFLVMPAVVCDHVMTKSHQRSLKGDTDPMGINKVLSDKMEPNETFSVKTNSDGTNLDATSDSADDTIPDEIFPEETNLKLVRRGLDSCPFICTFVGEISKICKWQFFGPSRTVSFRSSPRRNFSNTKTPVVDGTFVDKRGKRRTRDKWPIVFSTNYDINLQGLQQLHLFDAQKWGNVFTFLKEENLLSDDIVSVPDEADSKILRSVHTQEYLNSLKSSLTVAKVTEIPEVANISPWTVNQYYLTPMRFQVGGSILAAELAVHRGWAINIGGGFHHASANQGGGFCPYADITILIKWLFKHYPLKVTTAMIVDLDAHQGNGHENDFLYDDRVFIMDVYNKNIYPRDWRAKEAIHCNVELNSQTADAEYLELVARNLEDSLRTFRPGILVYNAGTDILMQDPLGRLNISPQGIIDRDKIVFEKAKKYSVPIVMLTSGGYLQQSAKIIARSILNLKSLNLISK